MAARTAEAEFEINAYGALRRWPPSSVKRGMVVHRYFPVLEAAAKGIAMW